MSPTLLNSLFASRLCRFVFRHPCVLVGRPVDGDRRFWNMPEPSSPSRGEEVTVAYFVPLEGEFADGFVTVFTRWPSGYASGPRRYRDQGRLRERIELLVRSARV